MKRICATLFLSLCTSTSFAQAQSVNWKRIEGVITALNVDNPVNDIHSGTFPWSTRDGKATVNLANGSTSFEVDGLVIVGAVFSGTPGPIQKVKGTLVCNAGFPKQAVLDTAAVPISGQGDAHFSGRLSGRVPTTCTNPLFLVRIAIPTGAAGLWIATAAERTFE